MMPVIGGIHPLVFELQSEYDSVLFQTQRDCVYNGNTFRHAIRSYYEIVLEHKTLLIN